LLVQGDVEAGEGERGSGNHLLHCVLVSLMGFVSFDGQALNRRSLKTFVGLQWVG
jgi:hypothetical protein